MLLGTLLSISCKSPPATTPPGDAAPVSAPAAPTDAPADAPSDSEVARRRRRPPAGRSRCVTRASRARARTGRSSARRRPWSRRRVSSRRRAPTASLANPGSPTAPRACATPAARSAVRGRPACTASSAEPARTATIAGPAVSSIRRARRSYGIAARRSRINTLGEPAVEDLHRTAANERSRHPARAPRRTSSADRSRPRRLFCLCAAAETRTSRAMRRSLRRCARS